MLAKHRAFCAGAGQGGGWMDGLVARLDECETQPGLPLGHRAALTEAVLDRSAAGLIGLDGRRRVVLCNRAAAEMLGTVLPELWRPVPLAELLATSTNLDPAGRAALERALGAATHDDTGVSYIATAAGGTLHLALDAAAGDLRLAVLNIAAANGVPSERTDGLTGLSDRFWFRERLAAMLAAAESAEHVAVLMIDLDRFKAVNDTHGRQIGDALLQVVAQRLRSAVREGDVVSRLGGDEFAVVMPVSGLPEVTAARLVDLLSRPYLIDGHVTVLGASIGIAIGPRDGADTVSLVRAADLAMYQAKEDGRRTVRVFTQSLDDRARTRHALLHDLRRALVLQQFEVHFQPQTDLGSGNLTGFEALVRWRHPEQGLIPPDKFIPIAEETGLIAPIGEWVLRTACVEAMTWAGELTVAVNVSPKQLSDREQLPRAVQAALALSGLPAHRLEVELTESALVRNESQALHVLHALHAMGVRVSMDDFGTGYSSLSQLRSFPFDKLKIDRSFMRDLAGNSESIAVVRAIAALGASLGMTTTAEGVETAEQEAIIRADGCTHMQGYLVSRPVPAGDVAGLIQRLCAERALSEEKPS